MVSNILRTTTVSLSDARDRAATRRTALEDRQAAIEEEAAEAIEAEGTIPASLVQEDEEVAAELTEVRGKVQVFDRALDAWDGTEFRIRELSAGEIERISDEISRISYEVDVEAGDVSGFPREGAHKMEVLKHAIEEVPPDAPGDPADLPPAIADWLYERVNALNTTGDAEVELGNSSLRERVQATGDVTESPEEK